MNLKKRECSFLQVLKSFLWNETIIFGMQLLIATKETKTIKKCFGNIQTIKIVLCWAVVIAKHDLTSKNILLKYTKLYHKTFAMCKILLLRDKPLMCKETFLVFFWCRTFVYHFHIRLKTYKKYIFLSQQLCKFNKNCLNTMAKG